jgi:hypothetical protein
VKAEDSVIRRLARFGALAVCVAAASAAEPRVLAASAGSPAARLSRAQSPPRVTSIVGAAWNADNSPIREARLRLRNAVTGQVDATIIGDTDGQFTFSDVEGGTYVVELVNDRGKVLALGQAFVVAPGETVATFVRLGGRVPWFTGFFQSAAAAATLSAASFGVTALAPVAPPVSAKR